MSRQKTLLERRYAALGLTLIAPTVLIFSAVIVYPLFSAIYLGCVPLGLSFFFWNSALNTGNITIIGYLSYLTPPLAVLLVSLVHGRPVSAQVLAGMGVILGAAMLGKIFMGKAG